MLRKFFQKIPLTTTHKKNSYIDAKLEKRIQMHNQSHAYLYGAKKPVWTDRNYIEFATAAYSKNVIAHRSIQMISQAAASIKIKIYSKVDGQKHEIHSHPIIDLLNNPNPVQSCQEFFESIYSYRILDGNAYVLCSGLEDKKENLKNIRNLELYTLRPDRMQVIAGENFNFIPAGYRYNINHTHIDYITDPITGLAKILHIKNFHPLSDWYGLSSIEAAAYSIDQHNQASAWNQSLLQNGANPTGAIIVKNSDGKPGMLTESERQNLRNSIEENFSGSKNAGTPLILEGGLDWKEMSLSPRDMDYIESKNMTAREIALALGMPPQLLGIPGDNTYSNLAEARKSLWEQTIIPLAESTIGHLNKWIAAHFDDNISIECDLEKIHVLEERNNANWERMEKSSILTVNEKRQKLGLSPLKAKEYDEVKTHSNK